MWLEGWCFLSLAARFGKRLLIYAHVAAGVHEERPNVGRVASARPMSRSMFDSSTLLYGRYLVFVLLAAGGRARPLGGATSSVGYDGSRLKDMLYCAVFVYVRRERTL